MRAAASGLREFAATSARARSCHPMLVGVTDSWLMAGVPASTRASEVGVESCCAHDAKAMSPVAPTALQNEFRHIRVLRRELGAMTQSGGVGNGGPPETAPVATHRFCPYNRDETGALIHLC